MTSTGPSPSEFLADPLSQLSRLERRNLLVASTIGLLVAKAGLLPKEISILGISFTSPEQSALLYVTVGAVLYFLVAFMSYGSADFLVWRERYQDYLEKVAIENETWTEQDQRAYDAFHTLVPKITWLYKASKPVAFTRVFFEYAFPVIFSLYVSFALAVRAYGA